MPTTNLGQVRDKITAIDFTSSTGGQTAGIPGADDTYTVKTECSPNGAGTFTVHNGADGSTVNLGSFSSSSSAWDAANTAVNAMSTDAEKRATVLYYVDVITGKTRYLRWCGTDSSSNNLFIYEGYGKIGTIRPTSTTDPYGEDTMTVWFGSIGGGPVDPSYYQTFLNNVITYMNFFGTRSNYRAFLGSVSEVDITAYCICDGTKKIIGYDSNNGNFTATRINTTTTSWTITYDKDLLGRKIVELGPYTNLSDALSGLKLAASNRKVKVVSAYCCRDTTGTGGGDVSITRAAQIYIAIGEGAASNDSELDVFTIDRTGQLNAWSYTNDGSLYIQVEK